MGYTYYTYVVLSVAILLACSKTESGSKYSISPTSTIQSSDQAGIEDIVKQRFEALFAELEQSNGFSGAILVRSKGIDGYVHAGGQKTYPSGPPNTADTRFGIGSISKQFTVAALLKLQEQGVLTLDDRLSKHYPAFAAGAEITLRQLLANTSGLPHVDELPDYLNQASSATSLEAFLSIYKSIQPKFTPGSAFHYSSLNFMLGARVVEIKSGKSFENYLQETIFRPLGMMNSSLLNSSNDATPYLPGPSNVPQQNNQLEKHIVLSGAGGIFSTVGDLAKWNEGLNSGKILNAESLAEMRQPNLESYGLGISIENRFGQTMYQHTGFANGYAGFNLHAPSIDTQLIILTNFEPTDFSGLTEQLIGIVFNQAADSTDNRDQSLLTKAKAIVFDLVESGEVDSRWENVTPRWGGKKDFGEGLESIVQFDNGIGTTLYLFFDERGTFTTYNFTGE